MSAREPLTADTPICTEAEARAAGLDIAPGLGELTAMAETIVAAAQGATGPEIDLARAVPLMAAEVERLRARVAELERPAIEAKRNEIRQSYAESIAMAREDRDFEGAFNVECQLREREEQWKREDAEAGEPR